MKEVSDIVKDFGEVCCGVKAVDHVKIRNTSKKAQCITVVPVNAEQIIYERLVISPQQILVQPGKSLRLTLTYLSRLENLFDVLTYHIFESEKQVANLNVLARPLGPCISSRIYNIKFFHFLGVNQTFKNIKLENSRQCEAKFKFDIDEDYEQIKLSHTHGVVPANSKINLKITFNPSKPGVYYKTIFCLIQYHPPLIFNILGMSQPGFRVEPQDLTVRYPLEVHPDCNYQAYMEKLKMDHAPEEKNPFLQKCATEKDVFIAKTKPKTEEELCLPPEEYEEYKQNQLNKNKCTENSMEVFLTTYFLDLKNQREIAKATTLVNFSKCQRYYFEWDLDSKEDFAVYPERGVVEPGTKTNFTIYFSPCEPESLYHTEMDLRVFPCDCESEPPDYSIVNLPRTFTLKIIGSSFPGDDKCGWMAQCTVVPNCLQLPFCAPNEIVYGTFMITRRGHLPVSFNVVQTKETNYLIQPPLGYLSGDYQLFVIEFVGTPKHGIYSEDVKIFFNNSKSMYETLKVATVVQVPKLSFGIKNSHTFTPVFPGAQVSETISIRNPTYLKLSYEFKTPEDITWYEVVNPQGTIEPNSSSEVTITFKPDFPCKYTGKLPCSVSSACKSDYVKVYNFELMGSCEYGYLVATPSLYDFGEINYLEEKRVKITLFNFSHVVINFKLTTEPKSFPPGDPNKDVIVTPVRGTVPGKCSTEIEVVVTPHAKEIFRYVILCQNLIDDSENAGTCDDPRVIFSFGFECVLSTLQIIDLTVEGPGHLFSPYWAWKMLNINKLNRGLNSLDKEFVVNFKYPEAMINSPPITIILLLEANKYGNFHCIINKTVNCPCLEASDEILTSCIHSSMSDMYPKELKVAANERQEVKIVCSYTELTECRFDYILDLPHRRTLILRSDYCAFPEDRAYASMYLNPAVHLKPIFIGDKNPPLQMFWIYNNNNKPAAYSVLSVTLAKENKKTQRICECINPNGTIPPFSSLPLGFLFRPNELRSYTMKAMLKLHEDKVEVLTLQGEGVAMFQNNITFGVEKSLPKKPILNYPNVDLFCLTNYVSIDLHRKFSQTKRIFFVKNKSRTMTWSFKWHTFHIENIIFAQIQPSSGQIEPCQTRAMTLLVESFSYETKTCISIPCDVINYTQLRDYEKAVRLQELLMEKTKDHFTITENGISHETPSIEIPEAPQLHHIHISVRVNILDKASIDLKLLPQQKCRLMAESEMETGFPKEVFLKTLELPFVVQTFEKTLWNILNRGEFWRKINNRKNSSDVTYLQLLPECRRRRTQECHSAPLQMSCIQSLIENELREILIKSVLLKALENATMVTENFVKSLQKFFHDFVIFLQYGH